MPIKDKIEKVSTIERLPQEYHKWTIRILLAASFILGLFCWNYYKAFLTKETTTGFLFFKKTIHHGLGERTGYFVIFALLLVCILIMLLAAWYLSQTRGKYSMYANVIKGHDYLSIDEIAQTVNKPEDKVINDIENMMYSGYLKDFHVDHRKRAVVNKGNDVNIFNAAARLKDNMNHEAIETQSDKPKQIQHDDVNEKIIEVDSQLKNDNKIE